MSPYVKKVCRLCLTEKDLHQNPIDEKTRQLLYRYFGLEVDYNRADASKLICLPCYNKVMDIDKFRLTIWRNQSKLFDRVTITIAPKDEVIEEPPEKKGVIHMWCERVPKEVLPPSIERGFSGIPTDGPPLVQQNPCFRTVWEDLTEEFEALDQAQIKPQPVKQKEKVETIEMEVLNSKARSSAARQQPSTSKQALAQQAALNKQRRNNKITGKELYKSLLMPCPICGKKIERNRLEGHQNKHSGLRPYNCPIEVCKARFYCKHARRLHVRCRHGTDSFACGLCAKVYKARRDLLGHIRETHAEPRFECDICPKKFTTRSRLKQHQYYHSGERKYPCGVCDMRFFSNFQLKVHMRTHTKSYPYTCTICKKDFRYRHMAKDHLVQNHGIDITLQKDWVIQHAEPDPEEVGVADNDQNTVVYNVQILETESEMQAEKFKLKNPTDMNPDVIKLDMPDNVID